MSTFLTQVLSSHVSTFFALEQTVPMFPFLSLLQNRHVSTFLTSTNRTCVYLCDSVSKRTCVRLSDSSTKQTSIQLFGSSKNHTCVHLFDSSMKRNYFQFKPVLSLPIQLYGKLSLCLPSYKFDFCTLRFIFGIINSPSRLMCQ